MSAASGTEDSQARSSSATTTAADEGTGAQGDGSDLRGPPEKKRRILQACINCSAKRVKCDGQIPCGTCVRNGDECGYAVPKKRGPPKGSTRPPRRSQASQGVKSESSSSSGGGTGGGSVPPAPSLQGQLSLQSGSSTQPVLNPNHAVAAPGSTEFDQSMLGFSVSGQLSHFGTNTAHAMPPSEQIAAAYVQRVPDWNPGPVSNGAVSEQHSRQNSLTYVQPMPSNLAPNPNMQQMSAPYPGASMMAGQYDTHSFFNRESGQQSQSTPPLQPLQPPPVSYAGSRSYSLDHSIDQFMAQAQPVHPIQSASQQQQQPLMQQHHPQQRPDATAIGMNPSPSSGLAHRGEQHMDPSPTSSYNAMARGFETNWHGSAVARRLTYPNLQQDPSHANLPAHRLTHASSSTAQPGDGRQASLAMNNNSGGLSASGGASNPAPLSVSLHHRGSTSSAPSTTESFPVGMGVAGGVVNGGGLTAAPAGEAEQSVEARSRFFRGGTSGLYGLATRLRDRDRHGYGPEAVGGVVLRTYSGNRNDAEDLGQDVIHGETDGSDRERERMGSTDSVNGASSRRVSVVHSTEHHQYPYQYQQHHDQHQRQHSVASTIEASPLQSPRLVPVDVAEKAYMDLFHRRQTSATERRQSTGGGAGAGWTGSHTGLQGVAVTSADQAFAAMTAQRPLSPRSIHGFGGAAYGAAVGSSQFSGQFSGGKAPSYLAVDSGLKAAPGPVSAGMEDDPRLHEIIWKAATVGGPAEAERPVFSGLNEAPGAFMQDPGTREDLDDLEVAVGDVNAPDFTSPLVSFEVEQKLLHLWIANIATHWTPVAPPTQEDIEAQPFLPLSDSEQHQTEAKIQQLLAAWRATIQPNRRPLLWSAILSMAADAWGGDLNEAGYPKRAASTSAMSTGMGPMEEMEQAALESTQVGGAAPAAAAPGGAIDGTQGGEHTAPNGMQPPRSHSVSGPATDVRGYASDKQGGDANRNGNTTRLMGKVRTGRQLSTALFIRAKFFLQRTNQEAGLEAIQASVFMALRESGAGRASQAAHYSTNACRMALDLGLHRHKAVKRAMGAAFTRHEDESRRRTLWCAYMLDKVIAFILGRPAVLRSAEIDCPFPSEDLPDEEMPWVLMAERFVSPAIRDRMRGIPSMVASTAVFGAKLSVIGEKIIEQYNIVKPSNWQSWVKNIHTQLQDWYGTLKPAMLDRNKHLPHSMNQLMWYNTLRILLHRPHILKKITEPGMPSSHAECTDAVNQVCQLLSTYESFYNVRKVSTSLAFILFTSVTIALSNTTSSDAIVVAEAKQRLQELMRWFKKASENYRAARHHLSIINVLAEGIEIGTGGSVRRDGDPLPSAGGQINPQAPILVGSAANLSGANAVNGGYPSQDMPDPRAAAEGHITTANFTGFAHSGVGYTYPAATLAAAQAAWRTNFGDAVNGAHTGGGAGGANGTAVHDAGGIIPVNGNAMDAGEVWGMSGVAADQSSLHAGSNGHAGSEMAAIPQQPQQQQAQGSTAAVQNPLDFLDSQAYLNLQSEAYWGAMPVSSENLLLWNSFHNEYISALAACTMEQNAGSTSAKAPTAAPAVENRNDVVGTMPQLNGHGAAGGGSIAATMYDALGQPTVGAQMPVNAGVYSIPQ
ncbi:hypothetical protein CF326_g133 [Tilletia indica]|nr:hypothetical protein CF326_g133 [Tilletia indica]